MQEQTDFEAEGLDVLFRKESAYHAIAVVQDSESRYLRFDNSFQSAMNLNAPFTTAVRVPGLLLARARVPARGQACALHRAGRRLGAEALRRDFPQLDVDAVELDKEVVNVAYRFFELPRDPQLEVDVEDGRRYLQRRQTRSGT